MGVLDFFFKKENTRDEMGEQKIDEKSIGAELLKGLLIVETLDKNKEL